MPVQGHSKFGWVSIWGAPPQHRAATVGPSSRARRDPRHRVDGGVLLPCVDPAVRDRPGVDVRLLLAERIPHHRPVARRTIEDGTGVTPELLRAPGTPPPPGAGLLPGGLARRRPRHTGPRAVDHHGARRRDRDGHLAVGRARGRGRRAPLRHELGRDRQLVLRVRAARAPVVTCRGGAVLPPLVTGRRSAPGPSQASRRRLGGRRGGRGVVPRRRVPRRPRRVAHPRHEHRHAGRGLPRRCCARGGVVTTGLVARRGHRARTATDRRRRPPRPRRGAPGSSPTASTARSSS